MSATPELPAPQSDQSAHLDHLRELVEDAIADGILTIAEMNSIRNALMADGKLTLEEVELVRDVMRQKLGDAPLEFETGGEVPFVSDLLL